MYCLICNSKNVVVALALLIATEGLLAHHSYSAVFDVNKKITITGTLTKVDWRNPHIMLFVDVKRADGHVDAWTFEASPPSYFVRRNISKGKFQDALGSAVGVESYRAKDNRLFGSLLKLTFADGTVVTSD